MNEALLSAIVSLAGSAIGAVAGIAVNARLSNYRLSQLEKKVDKHNNLVERMFNAESSILVLDEKVRAANERIADVEFSLRE